MKINPIRFLAVVLTAFLAYRVISAMEAQPQTAGLVLSTIALVVCFFLVLSPPRKSRRNLLSGHLLRLRCQRHPDLKGWVGYESLYQQYLLSRPPLKEMILSVAIRHPSGLVFAADSPARHHHVIALMGEYGASASETHDQGFLSSYGRYLSREQALKVGLDADQLIRKSEPRDKLFSEDLWAGPLHTPEQIEKMAQDLVRSAENSCAVVTIETAPKLPLAMGHHDMKISVRKSLPVIRYEMLQDRLKAAVQSAAFATAQEQSSERAASPLAENRDEIQTTEETSRV